MTQRTYYEPDGDVWTYWTKPERRRFPEERSVEIAHGYTFAELHRFTRMACARVRSWSDDMTTRFDLAFSGIAEHLCAAEEAPTEAELIEAGWKAIYRDLRDVQRMYGVNTSDRSYEVASAPRFSTYWRRTSEVDPHEARTERIAVHQILAELSETQQSAVIALAVTGDYRKAAEALGLKYSTFTLRMSAARKHARSLWFSPETAPPVRGTDRRIGSYTRERPTHCPRGHEWTPETTAIRRGKAPGSRTRRCRQCERERGFARREARQ